MGILLFSSIGILLLLSVPIITSRLANRMGRNPKKWFLIGILLPVVATIILFFLPEKTEENQ